MYRTPPVIAAAVLLFLTLLIVSSCVTSPGTSAETSAPQRSGSAAPGTEEDSGGRDAGATATGVESDTGRAPEAEEQQAPPTSVPGVRVLAAGQQSAVRIPAARTITSRPVFLDVWAAIHANQSEPPAPPDVDFDRETVIVLILGERRSGGYGVEVQRIVERQDSVTVSLEVTEPASGSMVTMALTSPYQITAVPITRKTFVFAGDDVRDGYSPYD